MEDKELDFETQMSEAKEILGKLMNPEVTLAQSVELYAQGMKRIKAAQEMLENARLQIREIDAGMAGES